jgi:hypothetical protein
MRAPADAIDSVADPPPAFPFACTTSSPPNWMRFVSAALSSAENFAPLI